MVVEPTQLKHMRWSNWIISPSCRGENKKILETNTKTCLKSSWAGVKTNKFCWKFVRPSFLRNHCYTGPTKIRQQKKNIPMKTTSGTFEVNIEGSQNPNLDLGPTTKDACFAGKLGFTVCGDSLRKIYTSWW